MSKLKILVIEDDVSYALELEMMLTEDYDLLPIAKSVDEALATIEKTEVDIILSDIFLEGKATGVDLVTQIEEKEIPIVIMTFSKDETLYQRAKSKNLIGYLVKPFDNLTLRSTIELAIEKRGLNPESIDSTGASDGKVYSNSFFIRTNKQLVKVIVSDIKWIQSDGNYCIVVTNSRKYAIKLSLTKILKKLPEADFIQAHKRYLVQLSYITQIDTSTNQLFISEEVIPIGRKYKPALFDRLGWFI